MESIILMTTGLLLDICGAFLIIKVFLIHIKNSPFYTGPDGNIWRTSGMVNFEDDKTEHDRQNQAVVDARYGFAFMSIGFTLILIGSWINYCEIHSC